LFTRHKYHLIISIAVFFTSGLWGLYWIPQRALENGGLTGGWGTAAQYVIPLIVLTPYILWKFIKGKRTGLHLPLIGLFFGGGIACYANSFLLTDIMRVFILFYLMPIWTTIFEYIFFKQIPKWQRGVSLFLAILGLWIVKGKNGDIPLPENVGDRLAIPGGLLCAAGIANQSPTFSGRGISPFLPFTIHKPKIAKKRLTPRCHLGICLKKIYSKIVVQIGIR
jgi:drug/metabolite transporter (DMT)-like permease